MTREERLTYWQGIINEYTDSGLGGAAFCREHGINPGRFYHWRRRLTDSNHCNESGGGFFELIPCASPNNRATIHVQLPNGIAIEVGGGFDPVTLRAVIETVAPLKPCSR